MSQANSHPGPRPKRWYRNSSPLVARMAHDLFFVGRLKQYEIARMFGVSPPTVSKMVSGRTWGER